jgi:hypothetical protein
MNIQKSHVGQTNSQHYNNVFTLSYTGVFAMRPTERKNDKIVTDRKYDIAQLSHQTYFTALFDNTIKLSRFLFILCTLRLKCHFRLLTGLRGKETVSFRPEVDSSARASVYTLLLH